MRLRKLSPVAAGLAVALAAAACSSSSGSSSSSGTSATTATGAASLKGVCPDTVVVQTDWFPESEYGTYYQLLGPGYKIDTQKKRITGPLVASGKDTGVKIEVRYGGPAIGFQQVSAQMYLDKSITFGQVSTDEGIQNSAKQPTLAVFEPTDISPYMIMWDKKKHPAFNTLVDVGQSNTKVLYYQTDTYMQYLLGAGILKAGQIDGSYDGAPSRWVASDGAIAQAGFATSEPYIYKHELGGGKSYDVDLQLINDTGYPSYAEALAIRAEDKGSLSPCLKKLVPIMQQAQVDFMSNPTRTNALVIEAVKADRSSVWNYSPGLANFAVQTLRARGLVSNGSNGTLGDMEERRVQRMIDILTPIFAGQKKPVKVGLNTSDIYTNEFIDQKIGLKTS